MSNFIPCQFSLDISQIRVSNIQGNCKEISALFVSLDSLVLGESFQIKGFIDLVEQVVAKLDDSINCTLVG
jgi:hypothetical protein